MPDAERLNRCPRCGRQCGQIKVCKVTRITCLLAAVEWREAMLSGCPDCLRRELKRHLRVSILPANLLWPFTILPGTLAAQKLLNTPGHSPEWIKLVENAERDEAEIAANAAGFESLSDPLPVSAETIHRHGTPYHAPDGRCGKTFLPAVLAWALFAIPVMSFLYALINFFVPYIAVVIAALFAFAALNGGGVAMLAKRCNCRSQRAELLAALALGIWSAYLAWVGWVWILNDFWSLGLIFDPLRLGRVIHFLAIDGIRGMGDRIVGAWEWYGYWALEALVLILTPLAFTGKRPGKLHCNRCGRPLACVFSLRQRDLPTELTPLRNELKHGDFTRFNVLPLRSGNAYLEAEVLYCPECRNDYIGCVTTVVERLDDQCNSSLHKTRFAHPVYLGSAETAELSRKRRK